MQTQKQRSYAISKAREIKAKYSLPNDDLIEPECVFPSLTWFLVKDKEAVAFEKIPLNFKRYDRYDETGKLKPDAERYNGRVIYYNDTGQGVGVSWDTLPVLASIDDPEVVPPFDESLWSIDKLPDGTFVVTHKKRANSAETVGELEVLSGETNWSDYRWSGGGIKPIPIYKTTLKPAIHTKNRPKNARLNPTPGDVGRVLLEKRYIQNGTFTGLLEIINIKENGGATVHIFPDDDYLKRISDFYTDVSLNEVNKIIQRAALEQGFSLTRFEMSFVKHGKQISVTII
jgi:hypothetical protein